MSHSYLYTKRFIDKQVKILGQPLELDSRLRSIIENPDAHRDPDSDGETELGQAQLAKILAKVNVRLKRHNHNSYSSQISHQVIQQVLKLEQTKIQDVNRQLARVRTVIRPLMVAESEVIEQGIGRRGINELGELVRELPESKYLLARGINEEDDEEDDEEDTSEDEDQLEVNALVVDEHEKVDQSHVSKRRERKRIKEQVETSLSKETHALLQQYDDLRQQLEKLHAELEYKVEKKEYLTELKRELVSVTDISAPGVDSDDEDGEGTAGIQPNLLASMGSRDELTTELNRFRILVEKIGYKLNQSGDNLRSVIHNSKLDAQ